MRTKMMGMLSLLVVAGFSVSLQAQTWSAYDQFDTINPGGGVNAWQYGWYETNSSSAYTKYNDLFDGTLWGGPATNKIHGMFDNQGDPYGSIHCNFGAAIDRSGWPSGMYWNAYSVTMQTMNAVSPVVRWTAPWSGVYQVNIVLEHNSSAAGVVTGVQVLLNGSVVDSGTISGFKSGPENFLNYSGTLFLSMGDYLEAGIDGPVRSNWSRVALTFDVTFVAVDPNDLPAPTMNLVMQLDASAGVKDPNGLAIGYGEAVGIWEDQSSGGLLDAMTEWGTPTRESGTFPGGSFDVIRFTGDDGLVIYNLRDPNINPAVYDKNDPNDFGLLGLKTMTVYVVGKINQDLSTRQAFFSNWSANKGYVLGISDVLPDYVKFWTNGSEMRSSGLMNDTSRYYLLAGTLTQISGKKLYINDCLDAESFGGTSYNDSMIVSVGALGDGSQFLQGDIAEIRVYDGFIESTHTGVVNELSAKYGLNRECLGGPNPDKVVLSALTFYGATTNGTVREAERWNTLWQDGAWDVALADGTVAELAAIPDPNNFPVLNVYDNMNIYVQMEKGQEYTFSWVNARPASTSDQYYGMNFFFDNAEKVSQPHGISVYANMFDVADTEQPGFLPNSSTTMGWPITSVNGAGTLLYKDFVKGLAVTLTNWVTYHENIFNLDLITRQTIIPGVDTHPLTGPDGEYDQLGQFTLRVDPYTATCDDLLALGDDYLFMDFNKDCYVNLEDFAQFATDWLKCNDPANAGCTD